MVENMTQHGITRSQLPGSGKTVGILGVPLAFGQGMLGVELGPAATRVAGLAPAIAKLGYEVNDRGDLRVERPRTYPREGEQLKYLNEVFATCSALAIETEAIIDAGELPMTIGGDHSIAIGSLVGNRRRRYRKRDQKLGLIYLDAHADMNTPETIAVGQHSRHAPGRVARVMARLNCLSIGGHGAKFDVNFAFT